MAVSNLYRALRRGTALKALAGREPFPWVTPRPAVVEMGSRYGGWAVDASRLDASSTVASFGLGEDVSFELALSERFGCRILGFDPTPRSVAYVREHVPPGRLGCHALALGTEDGTLTFHAPPAEAADQVSASSVARYGASGGSAYEVPCRRLSTIRREFGIDRLDVLKMDIEGAEYAVIEQLAGDGSLDEVSQLLVEFHHFLPGLAAAQTRQATATLLAQGFAIAWVGRTNHEYLFVRERAARAGDGR